MQFSRGTRASLTGTPLFPLRRLLVSIGVLLFAVHFTITALYLTPLNPIKLRLYPLIQTWMNPLFQQNWHLFAPNPLSSNQSLLARCRSGAITSDWIDITSAILDKYYENRLSSAKAIGGIQVNALISAVRGGLPIEEPLYVSYCHNKDMETGACAQLKEHSTIEFQRSQSILGSMAVEGCQQFMPGMKINGVFVRIAQLDYPRFSERHKPDSEGKAVIIDLGWHPAK